MGVRETERVKIVLNTIGVLAVLLGILGIFLPLLPTTPFLLLASACFARGSDRLHHWLLNHGAFGRYLRDFEEGRGIPLRAKIVASVMMWGSLLWSMLRWDILPLQIGLALTGVAVSTYLWRHVPTWRPRKDA